MVGKKKGGEKEKMSERITEKLNFQKKCQWILN